VFAAYVSGKGRAFVDRELYLPASWTDSRERCAQAGVPRRRGFATRPLLALDMIRRFWLSHQDLRWVAGDEVYGADPELRDWLEEHRVGYVLGIARDTTVATIFVFPGADHEPACLGQPVVCVNITLAIFCDFIRPVPAVRSWAWIAVLRTAMPETAVNEDSRRATDRRELVL